MRVVVINYSGDTRYTSVEDALLSTHDRTMIPCVMCSSIQELEELHAAEMASAEVLLINEGQFFPDIEDQVKQLVEHSNKRVYICGLDGDFNRKPIGNLLQLVPFSDHIIKLKSLCSLCRDGTPGVFSFRITNETDQVIIGSSNYIPLCRGCYQKETLKKEGGAVI
jgi:thymidine kinase